MIKRFESFNRNIAAAYKYIVKIKAYEMDKFGLKASHVMCLFYLGDGKSLTPSELCELCGEDKAGISKSLSALKEKGYIVACDGGEKKYKIKYKITDDGQKVYEEISDAITNVVESAGGELSEEIRALFYKTLEIIVSNLKDFSDNLDKKEDTK